MNWSIEFPSDFAVPAEIESLVHRGILSDASWHNDVCPSFEPMKLVPGRAGEDRLSDDVRVPDESVRIWVNHVDPEQREVGGKRFVVCKSDEANGLLETDDLAELLAWVEKNDEWQRCGAPVVERAKQEILQDIAAGRVPATVQTFAELHDHVDANHYGGAFEGEFDGSDEVVAFWSRVQNELHAWLVAGQHRLGLKDEVKS